MLVEDDAHYRLAFTHSKLAFARDQCSHAIPTGFPGSGPDSRLSARRLSGPGRAVVEGRCVDGVSRRAPTGSVTRPATVRKSRAGYLPTSLAQTLAEQAERAEQALEAARIGVEQGGEVVSGTVRLTCTDSVLQGLLLPALAQFMPNYPALTIELSTSNDFANLSRRDADIALRLTRTPPEHLVGRELAKISYRVCASQRYLQRLKRPIWRH